MSSCSTVPVFLGYTWVKENMHFCVLKHALASAKYVKQKHVFFPAIYSLFSGTTEQSIHTLLKILLLLFFK